jgi:hypothetical protein
VFVSFGIAKVGIFLLLPNFFAKNFKKSAFFLKKLDFSTKIRGKYIDLYVKKK